MIRSFLDLSTGHVSRETSEWLNARAQATIEAEHANSEPPVLWVASTGYGWFLYARHDLEILDRIGVPEDLKAVMRLASEMAAEFIMFDRDAPILDNLPFHDWETEPSGEAPALPA